VSVPDRGAGTRAISRSDPVTLHAQVLGYPTLAGWALAGDFAGIITLAVGLHAATSIRIADLMGRLYIDFKN
jgi:hypothetical protein